MTIYATLHEEFIMRIKLAWSTICPSLLLITSCASTTIFPSEGNTFTSISNSSEQSYAETDAKNKAEKHCKQLGKHLSIINHQTNYHGPDNQTKLMGAVAAQVLNTSNMATSQSDFEIILHFKCI